ncbi:hypothetical protein PQX77_013611 [Marasmius sp. AFHP31]|nr:hypothetical protein PQX77_013611 [Marasmius sp. AFHP31]
MSLTRVSRHGSLTFGAVVDSKKPGIVAHFATTPAPKWYCKTGDRANIQIQYSKSVPSRVDLTFCNSTIGSNRATMYFSLRVSDEDRSRLRAAFLSQSLPFYNTSRDAYDLVYIDEIGFSLAGTFSRDPTTYPAPVYLFISPKITVEKINGMHCIHLPLGIGTSLFYWSFDPKGIHPISEEDWDKHGIPKLATRVRVGSSWSWRQYECVEDHLRAKGYVTDGKNYAREYAYPELVHGDPHDLRFEPRFPVVEDVDEPGSLVDERGENERLNARSRL